MRLTKSPISREFIVPMIVACALFMENLDSTVISTALPAIARSLGENPLKLNLAITCYLLSLGIFIPISGWMADRFGSRTVFSSAIIIFTLGSIGCASVSSLPGLMIARVIQGMGGAMMVPVGRLVILRTIPKAQLVQAMAYLTVPALLGPVLGPPLGGFIATFGSWRWIFLINIPIGILGLTLALMLIPNIKEPRSDSFDWPGFALVGLGLAGAMFGFETIGRDIIPGIWTAGLVSGGVVLLVFYYLHARKAAFPIIDLRLMRIRTFSAAIGGGFLFRMGIGALPFLVPLMLQLGFGLTPFESGMITFAGAAGAMTMKFTAGPILRRLGFRRTLLWNSLLCAVFMACYGLFRPETPHLVIILTLLVGGFFRSLQFTGLNTLAYADIDSPRMSRATTFSSVAQQLSLSFGVGCGAMLLHFTLLARGQAQLSANDFWPAFVVVGVLMGLSSISFWRMAANAGDEISGRGAHAHPTPDQLAPQVPSHGPGIAAD